MFRVKDRSRNKEGYSYISDRRFEELTINARRNGAIIVRGGEEVEKHLDAVGANAACINDVLLFRQNVTVSEVLEETRHFEQFCKGTNADKPEELKTILNEIDAKRFIIDNAQKYGVPQREIDETILQLNDYLKRMSESEGIEDV